MGTTTDQYTVRQITVAGGGEGVAVLCNLNVLVKLNGLERMKYHAVQVYENNHHLVPFYIC